jgi:chromosome segregation ATPase
MEADFQEKCQEFLNNEKILKQNMEVMQKYSEELERERTNERTLRLKLEEEYMQNSKNHEEEVQLRLRFESKLNSMHSAHRQLEIKHKRLQQDLEGAEEFIGRHEATIKKQGMQVIHLRTTCDEQATSIKMLEERRDALEREMLIKAKQVMDAEGKLRMVQDELDLKVYSINDQIKLISQQRMNIDVCNTKLEGLSVEVRQLDIQLKEVTSFKELFEHDNAKLREEYAVLLEKHNAVNQEL